MTAILDLCAGTGSWSQPYADAGYDVIRVDTLTGDDVLTYKPPEHVHGILAAPPCTEFAGSGARWWTDKPPWKLRSALEVVYACLRIIAESQPAWWALENPVGRLTRLIGPWRYTFQPWEYGDPETKRTCIWGDHAEPERVPVEGPYEAKVHRMAPSTDRAALRSITPPGYARAFMKANP